MQDDLEFCKIQGRRKEGGADDTRTARARRLVSRSWPGIRYSEELNKATGYRLQAVSFPAAGFNGRYLWVRLATRKQELEELRQFLAECGSERSDVADARRFVAQCDMVLAEHGRSVVVWCEQ